MTYSSGGLIEATDYNGFATGNANNINSIWGTGSGDKGYNQTPSVANVSVGSTVTATQWATLINTMATIANHQGTSFSYTAPVAGNTITFLNNLSSNVDTLVGSRGNAVARGTQYTAWTGTSSQTSAVGVGNYPWTIVFTHTVTFPSADQARYFFNAGGMVKWETSKTADATDADTEWNDLANTLVGDIYITGGTATQTIAGTAYTGTTKVGGTGTPNTLTTTTGWYDLTTVDTLIYKQFADTSPYTGAYIQIQAKVDSNTAPTVLTLTTTWSDPGGAPYGSTDGISGGTATTGITFGTAPATVVTYYPPSSTYLSNTWGTPTVAASVSTTGAATITYVDSASTQNTVTTGTLVINKPTGTAEGDLMLAFVGLAGASTTAVITWTVPADWTEVYDRGTAGNSGVNNFAIAYKIANAAEGASYTFTSTQSIRARTAAGSILTYRGAVWDKLGNLTANVGGASMSLASITPTNAQNYVIAYVTTSDASQTYPTPVGMTSRVADSGGTGPSYTIWDQPWTNVATGNRITATQSNSSGLLLSIKSA